MSRKSLCVGLFYLLAPPALAASRDCSTATIPYAPVKGMVAGVPFLPKEVTVQIKVTVAKQESEEQTA